jgi:glyoxylase-like metal-dependent hydrolase (beta-lactamase superfamily II)
MQIKAYYDAPTFTLTYLVWDASTKDAVVIDPVLDYDPLSSNTSTRQADEFTAFLREHGLKLRYVLETHAHADRLSGSQVLRRRTEAKVAIAREITKVQQTFKAIFDFPEAMALDGSQFDLLLDDGQVIDVGALQIECIATPGHTPACLTFKIGDALFTGDALFMDDYGTGRCDFPGGSADTLYTSIHERLYGLPDETRVFVGHDYQPGGRALKFETTIGKSKRYNPQLRAETSREEFVSFRQARDKSLAAPRLIFQSVQVNANAGRMPAPTAAGIRHLKLPINLFRPADDVGEPL